MLSSLVIPLASQPVFPAPNSLINPTLLAWIGIVVYPWLHVILLVSPRIWVDVSLLLSRFGHDRAINDFRFELLNLGCVLPNFHSGFGLWCFPFNPRAVVLLCVHSGWSLDCLGVEMEPECA